MSVPVDAAAEARADRRVVLTALAVMVALVLFGVGFASLFAATNCRRLDPDLLTAPRTALAGDAARDLLVAAGAPPAGLAALEAQHGPVTSAVALPLAAPLRLGPAPTGVGSVVVTGDGVAVVDAAGSVRDAATFPSDVTVVGDGVAVYALVVGNTLTGQVDALRPLVVGAGGLTAGACVDTSAVGSPLAFLHDARDGRLLGLRTDEDGSEAVLELRDHVRGRVWAPPVALPRAPAGLQGARTSAALGPDVAVLARRIADTDAADVGTAGALRAFGRIDGTLRWEVDATAVRDALPADLAAEPALRLEVAHVDATRARIVAFPDVAVDAPLPLPTFGPLGELRAVDPRAAVLDVAIADATLTSATAPAGRDGAARDALRADVAAAGLPVTDVLATPSGMWLLVADVLVRLGG